ncbi:MAG: helix-turn-helix transcriptional regulator [Pseudolysinimonas sp.]
MSNLIQSTRAQGGITGRDLASRLGITIGAVSQMERSERDGTIQLATLDRALRAMGLRAQVGVREETPASRYGPERVTQTLNEALDAGDTSFALRALTRSTQQLTEHPEAFTLVELVYRPSRIKDPRWESLFRALYGAALPSGVKPDWATPKRLSRAWYPSEFSALRERAKRTSPPALRALNIFIDERSLVRA